MGGGGGGAILWHLNTEPAEVYSELLAPNLNSGFRV